jgi:hypothetical protein
VVTTCSFFVKRMDRQLGWREYRVCAGGGRGSVRGTAVCGLGVVVWACSPYGAGQLQSDLQNEHRYCE